MRLKNIYIGKRGFSTGKAVVGGLLTGNVFVAAAAGRIGANKIVLTCLDCGHEFKIGEGDHNVDFNKHYPSKAEIAEFEKHVIPKEEMPKLTFFICDCGKEFSAENIGAYCPSCGRRMTEKNIPSEEDLKKRNKTGCLGFLLFPIILLLSIMGYWL